MVPNLKIVVSASRRTDIPAFYMPWFMDRIARGAFTLVNPFNRRTTTLKVSAETVHSIVFWSKNYGPFLDGDYGQRLLDLGFHLFFNFTINSREPILEPQVPPLAERIDQVRRLGTLFGIGAIQWRFDPLCFYVDSKGAMHDNRHDFEPLAVQLAALGVTGCITSFMDLYPKIKKRLAGEGTPKITFIDPPLARKVALLREMEAHLNSLGMTLFTCCEAEVMAHLPAPSRIAASSCVPNRHLMELYGGQISTARDAGQRTRAGCHCQKSVDIGVYHEHPCRHDCLFCYANPYNHRPASNLA